MAHELATVATAPDDEEGIGEAVGEAAEVTLLVRRMRLLEKAVQLGEKARSVPLTAVATRCCASSPKPSTMAPVVGLMRTPSARTR